MDHIIRLADLRDMLADKDPTDKIVACSESGTQYTIADIGRDGGHGRILINFHDDTGDKEKINELDKENTELNRKLELLKQSNEELSKALEKFADHQRSELEKIQKLSTAVKAIHES